jgi:four helix bundle protein
MKDYKKLNVFEKAHELALNIYKATAAFPKDELYGLTSQMRRACVSIPSNIVEGCGRKGDAELSQFIQIALGSTNELGYQLLLAHDLKYLSDELFINLNDQIDHVRRMLIMLLKKTREQV